VNRFQQWTRSVPEYKMVLRKKVLSKHPLANSARRQLFFSLVYFFSANRLFIVFDLFIGESKKWLEYVTATCSRSSTASLNMVWLYNAHAFEWQRYVVKTHASDDYLTHFF